MTPMLRAFAAPLALLFSLSVQAEEVTLPYQGITLRAELEQASGWPAEPVLLMTHGTLAHNHMDIMSSLQQAFKEREISSLAINLSLGIDQRESAMYDCATPHRHRQEDAVAEIGAWLEWLKGQGVKQVVLLGHSRGGAQTAWFAAEHPDPAIRSVILIAPATGENAAEEFAKRTGKPLAPLLAEAKELVAAGHGDTLINTSILYCDDTRATAAALLSYYGDEPRRDTRNLLPSIQRPVLVIAGSEDTVVPELQSRLGPLADGTRVQLKVIEGADHFFRDLYAEDVADAATQFMAAH